MSNLQKRKTSVAVLSIVSNSLLILFKVIIGLAIGSVSIISEAIHSGVDLLAAVIALFAVQSSSKPADENHPFGHGKIENLSGTIEALLIFMAAAWIFYEAVHKLSKPTPLPAVDWGLAVMLFSASMNWFVSRLLFKVGKETDSIALQADAWHLRTDVWTSLGVFAGLLIIKLAQRFWPQVDVQWIDPIAAIGVALLILRAAYQLTIQSGSDLLDISLSPEEEAWIRNVILTLGAAVRGFHRLRTRKSGPTRFVEFHLLVDPDMTVENSHQLTIQITAAIEKRFPHSSVTIHIEPCNGYCSSVCVSGCLLTPDQRTAVQKKRQKKPAKNFIKTNGAPRA